MDNPDTIIKSSGDGALRESALSRRGFIAGGLAFASTFTLCACSGNLLAGVSADDATEVISGVGEEGSLEYVSHIDKMKIMNVEITADPDTWQSMLDNATAEEYIPADISIDNLLVENAAIRPKGNSSLSSIARDSSTDRYSFKIKFDEYVDGQTWLGLDKLVLNGNWSDASSMKEYLSYDILELAGVATPLFAYASIKVNGEPWGFYLLVEVLDKAYRVRTQNGIGEMYKPESMEIGGGGVGNFGSNLSGGAGAGAFTMPEGMTAPDGTQVPGDGMQMPEGMTLPEGMTAPDGMTLPDGFTLPEGTTVPEGSEVQGGAGFPTRGAGGMGGMGAADGVSLVYVDDEQSSYSAIFDNAETNTDKSDHARVIEAIKNLNAGTELERYIDVDACLRYFAAHNVVVNLDSYSGSMGHNYYLYEYDGQIAMLPWDYNMSFGGFQASNASTVVNFPLDTPVSGTTMEQRPLIAKLFEVPEYLEGYHTYVRNVMDGYFVGGLFEAKVDEVDALIGTSVADDPSAFYTAGEYRAAVIELKKLGNLRAQSVIGQLDGTIPATTEAQQADGSALVDASSLNLQALGSSNMGGGNVGGGGFGGRGGQRPESTVQ